MFELQCDLKGAAKLISSNKNGIKYVKYNYVVIFIVANFTICKTEIK